MCDKGLEEEVDSFLKKKKNLALINKLDENGWTALHCASNSKKLKIIRALLKAGADPRLKTTGSQNTSLHYLAKYAPQEEEEKKLFLTVLKLMVDKGADIDAVSKTSATPLHEAAFKGAEDVALFLIKNRADINKKTLEGDTPLHYAIHANKVNIVKLLLANGADTDTGKNALDVAVKLKREEIAKLLTEHQKRVKENEGQLEAIIIKSTDEIPSSLKKILDKSDLPFNTIGEAQYHILFRCIKFLHHAEYRWMPGSNTILFNKRDDPRKLYKVIEQSGKGGYGRVFQAFRTDTDEVVALKKLTHVDKGEKMRNLEEILTLKNYNHENIVSFFDAYYLENEIWICMEYLEGGTLRQVCQSSQLTEEHIGYMLLHILDALYFLHKHHRVHRDLKSQNIMLSKDGWVKLIDFGLSCDIGNGHRTELCGTAQYMAPEMIQMKPYDELVDIWALGILVVEMADGAPPFAENPLKGLFQLALGRAPSVNDPSKWSDVFLDFLLHCLEIDPRKRWSPKQLLQHDFLSEEKIANEKEMAKFFQRIFTISALDKAGFGFS
eukprot:TRINITY_DN3972_c0_g1_i1.p1 TRINITY_DN3972_c0_g1~~TRINITY_DN3972_c0_g1_i1.p1  ORF type:complete len:552 (+),score=170.83 TRINITY_DN3972_c0_g1_i1:523-2178(+)